MAEPIVQRGHLSPAGRNPAAGQARETSLHIIYNSNRRPPPGQEHAYMRQLATRLDQFCNSEDMWMQALREPAVAGRHQVRGAYRPVRRNQVLSIEWRYRVEMGDNMHRVHYHLYPVIRHTTRLQFNYQVLADFICAGVPWACGGWHRLWLLPSSDYPEQLARYTEETGEAHRMRRRRRPRRQ